MRRWADLSSDRGSTPLDSDLSGAHISRACWDKEGPQGPEGELCPANFGAELQQLPLQYMLSEPLTAVIKAQALAAQTTIQFIQSFGRGGGAAPTWTA
jgi:hypothetical protein